MKSVVSNQATARSLATLLDMTCEHIWTGMSTFDFNSLIRRRNLDELTDRLLEEGRVHYPNASAGNGLASVEEQAGPAQTPTTSATPTVTNIAFGSPVPAVVHIDGQPRPASSVYSRDIDGNSYRSASTVQDVSIRSPGPRSLLPPLVSWQNSPESSSSSSVLINGPIDPDGMFPAAVEVSDGDYSITNPSASSPSWTNVASLVPVPLKSQCLATVVASFVEAQTALRSSQ